MVGHQQRCSCPCLFFCKQNTAYEMRISDWSSDVCSSDLNQSGLYKKSTVANTGNMIAAKYRLEGSISSIVKRSSDYKDVFYKFSLQLIDVESGLAERSEEHTSELQSLMRISYAVFCLIKKTKYT